MSPYSHLFTQHIIYLINEQILIYTRHKKLLYIKQGNWNWKALYNFLLNKGAAIYSCGRNKDIPLQKANKRGHESISQLLLDTEKYTSPYNENKETPLHKVCERGHESIENVLFDQGADINCLTIRNKLLYI